MASIEFQIERPFSRLTREYEIEDLHLLWYMVQSPPANMTVEDYYWLYSARAQDGPQEMERK